jgi:para-aminobenzoate synthetase component 1
MTKITPIDYEPDSDTLFAKLWDLPYACWLDSGKPSSDYGRYDIISALPASRIISKNGETKIYHHSKNGDTLELYSTSKQDPLKLLHQELGKLSPSDAHDLPFGGGAIGYFAYDLGRRYIHLSQSTNTPSSLKQDSTFADMAVGIYHWALIQDHKQQKAWLVSLPECNPTKLKTITARLSDQAAPPSASPLEVSALKSAITQSQYEQQLENIHNYILAGDCYQVNFAQRFQGNYTGSPYEAYKRLRQQMASPFCAFLQFGNQAIMSLSPERFLKVEGRKVLTQPIKGTVARNHLASHDKQQAQHLQNDEKNRAENLMIVDLLRNDLGQHCKPGSIEVEELFGLQSFPNVHHLVSTISGQLQEESHSLDLFRDCFPGGSITGAPKKRAMEIIDELETDYRGVYCGSIGYINSNGDMDTNIAIRTVSCDGEQISCWGGGGIVADSVATDEYQESLDKINKILDSLNK